MTRPFDPILKTLVETEPAGWLTFTNLPAAEVIAIDADVSSVLTGSVDKVLQVHADPPYLLHLDFQSGHDTATLPRRLRLYNVALNDRHGLPVRSRAVILRPEADSPQLDGLWEQGLPDEEVMTFHYRVIRVWQIPVADLLQGGLGTLPLAP